MAMSDKKGSSTAELDGEEREEEKKRGLKEI
jgi:hypothetical protein